MRQIAKKLHGGKPKLFIIMLYSTLTYNNVILCRLFGIFPWAIIGLAILGFLGDWVFYKNRTAIR